MPGVPVIHENRGLNPHAGTHHGFHNDATPRYDEVAAKLAWRRTLAFFQQNLKA